MKIIAAVDGSDQSKLITQHLLAFQPIQTIVLLHALHVPQLAYPGTGMSVGHEFSARAEQELRVEGSRLLKAFAAQLPEDSGRVHQRLETGSPAEVILRVSEEEQADLIVVGSRGLGVIREHALGSVSHRVATHAPCSTLIVKNRVGSFQHIAVPVQQESDAEAIVSFLSTKPFRGNSKVSLLHVIPFAQPALPVGALIPESWRKDLFQSSEAFLNKFTSRLSSYGYTLSATIKAGSPSLVLHEEIVKEAPDLLIISPKKPGRLRRFILGSVSHSLVHHSRVSVLVLKG